MSPDRTGATGTASETEDDDNVSLRHLSSLLRVAYAGFKGQIILITVLAFISAMVEALIVLLIAAVGSMLLNDESSMTRSFLGVEATMTTTTVTVMILGAAALRAVLDLVLVEVRARLEASYEATARRQVARLYLDADWELQSTERSGGLQALLVGFISHARNLLKQLTSTIVSAMSLVIMLGASLIVGGAATLVAIGFLVMVAFMLRSLVRHSRMASVANRGATVSFSDRISETVSMALEIRTLGISDEVSNRVAKDIDDMASAQLRSSRANGQLASIHTTLTYVAVGVGTLALVLLDVANPQPYAAMILLLYRSMVYGRAVQTGYQNIVGAQPYLQELDRRWNTYQDAREDRGTTVPDRVRGVHVERACFSYAGTELALDDVSFTIEDGEALGIVGPSGAGKSTIVQLLLGLRHPQSGRVALGDVDLRGIDPAAIARLVGYVPQDAHLFDASVVDNVTCLRPWITHQEAVAALEQAHVLQEVLSMPAGLDNPVGVGGRQLSGGQRQRVCIARALAGAPKLLILDEPTSALDLASEEAIRLTLEGLRGRISLVIIAHRMSTLRVCDRILVLRDGKVDGLGSRHGLESESTYYAEALRLAALT